MNRGESYDPSHNGTGRRGLMPRLGGLSGEDVLGIVRRFEFRKISQRDIHIKLRRFLPDETRQTLTIVFHHELDKGTLRTICRPARRFIPERELRLYFFADYVCAVR